MDNDVRWLLVGTGDIARKRAAAALVAARNSRLVAVCSRTMASARGLAAAFGQVEGFDKLADALADSSCNAVYLATPVWLHAPQAIQVLEAGKHVLVEKPLGIDASECAKIVAAAERSRRVAGCAYYRRFYPRFEYTKNSLGNGELGSIIAVRMAYSAWYNSLPEDPKYWRVIRAKSGGGPLMDMGCHMLDVMIGLFGVPESVYAKCANLVHSWDVEDSAAIVMRLRNGALVDAHFNWNTKMWQHEFEIVGTEGKIVWSPYDTGPVIKTVGNQVECLDLKGAANVHIPLVEDFVQSVLTNCVPRSTVTEAIKTNILLDAIYESASMGRELKLTGNSPSAFQ